MFNDAPNDLKLSIHLISRITQKYPIECMLFPLKKHLIS